MSNDNADCLGRSKKSGPQLIPNRGFNERNTGHANMNMMNVVTLRGREIAAKLWNASRSLQGGGVSYLEYTTELTFLLFLKMLEQQRREHLIPDKCRWSFIRAHSGKDLLAAYREALRALSDRSNRGVRSPQIKLIFAEARTSLTLPANLQMLIDTIDSMDWFSLDEDGIGNLYEDLLERTTGERKSKAGQYFTPRALIDAIVRCVKPKIGESIQDPAAGTGGFLIAARRYLVPHEAAFSKLRKEDQQTVRSRTFHGQELVGSTFRLALMNLMLHGVDQGVVLGDTLGQDGRRLGTADIVLTNPPFNRFAEPVLRPDLFVTRGSRKGPLPFLEHAIGALRPGGRCAIVVPDNVLFENGEARELRRWLMDRCDLHTVLRLPPGIFYSPGVKTNVLFFARGDTNSGQTKATWFYDLRAQMPSFGKTRQLSPSDFSAFEKAFGVDAYGKSRRVDGGVTSRFRCFTREQIATNDDNLDISWFRTKDTAAAELFDRPEDLAAKIAEHLQSALTAVQSVGSGLSARPARGLIPPANKRRSGRR